MHVWIITDFQVLNKALTELVTSLGFKAHATHTPEVEIALAYLTRTSPPYPAPPAVPTLALFSGSEDEVIRLLQTRLPRLSGAGRPFKPPEAGARGAPPRRNLGEPRTPDAHLGHPRRPATHRPRTRSLAALGRRSQQPRDCRAVRYFRTHR